MGAFNAVMNYAISKRYVPASNRFEGKPKLKTMRRDAFTAEEYRKLHSVGRKWIKEATTPQGTWYRTGGMERYAAMAVAAYGVVGVTDLLDARRHRP
jgi:hypothetical protein